MARRDEEREFERTPRRRRRGKLRYILGLLGLAGVILIACLPTLAARRSVLVPLIDRFAGLAPLRVDFESVSAGWFKPVEIGGLQIFSGDGNLLARVGSLTTEKGIWAWLRDSSNLGTIRLSEVESAVATYDGTTNIEQALQPLLAQFESPPTDETTTELSAAASGRLELLESRFLLMQRGRPEQWLLVVPNMTVQLPTAEQLIGPIELKATLAEVSGTISDASGQPMVGKLAARVQQTGQTGAFEVQAQAESVPIDFWHVLQARVPGIPIEALSGRVSADMTGRIVDADRWSFDIRRLEGQRVKIVAPQLVGELPAKLQLVSAAGKAELRDLTLKVEGANLSCDFATTTASAVMPWPLEFPTPMNPFVRGAQFEARGSVDLPKLAQAAQSLLPVRDDTQLVAGTAQFAVSQSLDDAGAPTSRAKLELSQLQAVASGQTIRWNEPLIVEMAADHGPSGALRIGAMAAAEFCSLKAGGTIEAGQMRGQVDLDLLQQRLSEYIELPIRTMTGSADLDLNWKVGAEQLVEATGVLTTTPLTIAATTGSEIHEPAWNGKFNAAIMLDRGTPSQINRAQLTLESAAEQLTIDLQEPVQLVANAAPAQPAAFALNLVGDLANWKRRGTMWLAEPPDVQLAGNLSLAVGGRLDLSHVEILQANWRSQPLQVATPQISFAEPQMVGNFQGRVDTADLTRLMVEKLEVQATSFSLGARDSANPDGSGSRVGQAMFLVDLDRLLKSAAGAPDQFADLNNSEPTTQYVATGRVQGQLAWQVSSQVAAVQLQADAENLNVSSKASPTAVPEPLWQEPTLRTHLTGQWVAESGDINIDSLKVQAPWMNYVGNLSYHTLDTMPQVRMRGQAVYDSVQLTAKLAPLTGNQVQLFGQQTVPIELTWTGSSETTRSTLAGLTAVTQVGWERARVAGIDLGKADVPVRIDAGHLATAAELPVSGGILRWDVTSDLTVEELVIVQQPMTVLENVEITEQMCQGWLKYVTPLLAEATSVDGRLSVRLDQARLTPADPAKQSAAGQLVIHNATVGPGPLSNQVIGLVKQVDAIRKKEFAQPVSTQKVWMNMPEQRIDFQMLEGRVMHRNLNVRVGDANISTSGAVGVDGQLEMLATMPIPDDWVEKSPLLVGMRGQSLQFPLRGTLSQPRMDTDGLKQFSVQAVQSAASGVIQQQLSRGLEKLFGSPPPPSGN